MRKADLDAILCFAMGGSEAEMSLTFSHESKSEVEHIYIYIYGLTLVTIDVAFDPQVACGLIGC